ncbi:hypothetical protein [Permianibacter aggregans]|uniref:Uncharacterized protein n=1 Tax=Permianibacter aggregans TaxID=1510150 RepID=A0A4R6UKB3_9GAMM|nr:hypothetical protein [Permianibacter aggregans]QGX40170.1 hypothetical protein E2H98_11005 [Permianibacter aggregans]TDQ47420.1 hypothetical protein EV696_11012 [Permianibacter aggregans]
MNLLFQLATNQTSLADNTSKEMRALEKLYDEVLHDVLVNPPSENELYSRPATAKLRKAREAALKAIIVDTPNGL